MRRLKKQLKQDFKTLRGKLKNDPKALATLMLIQDVTFQYEPNFKDDQKASIPHKEYHVKKYKTYAAGIHAKDMQPFTSKDNLEARIKDQKLFNDYQDSCTAIIYSGESKFKIDLKSGDLLGIDRLFNDSSMMVDYESNKGLELDINEGIYNKDLTREEFLEHKGWDALFGEDKGLKKDFADKVYKGKPNDYKACPFVLKDNAEKGELKSIVLCNIITYRSAAIGKYDINTAEMAHFLKYVLKD